MRATLTVISPLAEMSTSTRTRAFHAYAALGSAADPRVRPGMNGSMDIVTERIDDARIIPALALFTRRGRPIVYVVDGEEFRATEVEVEARNSDEIAVRGLDADARVTLVDPFADTGMEEDEQSESGEGL
jgi:hypothetical protein